MAAESECSGWRVRFAFFATEPAPAAGAKTLSGAARPDGARDVVGSCTVATASYSAKRSPHNLWRHEAKSVVDHRSVLSLGDLPQRTVPASRTHHMRSLTAQSIPEG
jgi:hypothetical protein